MPWKDVSTMSLKAEFARLVSVEGANMSELCRRFQISRRTGYKWQKRYSQEGDTGLEEHSRRPLGSPVRTELEIEQRVLDLRNQHPCWGGRKLRRLLQQAGLERVPSASTITEILRRHGLLNAADGAGCPRAFQRFEREAPNELWQMDFKGHFPLSTSARCHPLTLLDDHSRFSVCLRACDNERTETVQQGLMDVFRRYGIPRRMLMDNGAPWGDEGGQPWTKLTVWIVRLGIGVSHGRPCHPQTQGKLERWHKTLKAEILRDVTYGSLPQAQAAFDAWRVIYNTQRPHDSLDLGVPADRYRASERSYPEALPAIEYAPGVQVRKVQSKGMISFQGYDVLVGKAFEGDPIGIQQTTTPGVYDVNYCHHRVGQINLTDRLKGGPIVRLER